MTVQLSNTGLSPRDVVTVARDGAELSLTNSAVTAIESSAAIIDRILDGGESVYGVTTGFGALADTPIPPDRSAELQVALVRSHAAGMGPLVECEVVRATMALRARSLARGFSGVRPIVVRTIIEMLNAGITPLVHEHGSLGASGDLAPLAHCAMGIIGEGEVFDESGQRQSATEALNRAGIQPVKLRAKEGLALINGTDGMLGMLVLALSDLDHLLKVADVAAALTIEGLMGTDRVFASDLQELRPQLGQADSAANLRALLSNSEIMASHAANDSRVQDAYSLRCTPAVHGAVRDTIAHAKLIAERELASAIDNPMILPDGRVESCGNFHGAPIAQVADFLAISIADLGALCERRTDRMLDVGRSHGLPPFLAADPGLDSGLMIAHYTQAGMVAVNRRLAVPASVDTIPTSAMQEDHVSMGWGACRKLREAVQNLGRILAVEITAGTRAIECRAPLQPSPASVAALSLIRERVPGLGSDRWLSPELDAVSSIIGKQLFVTTIEAASDPLL